MLGNVRVVNGQNGGVGYGDTVLHTFAEDLTFNATNVDTEAYQLQVITAAKFHTLTGNLAGVANVTSGSAVEVPAGVTLVGKFTAMQLHSGFVVAYRKSN